VTPKVVPRADVPAPVAAQHPYSVRSPNGDRADEYYWLRDDTRSSQEMLRYLSAENAYKDALLAPLAASKQALRDEIVSRIAQTDESVPVRDNGYDYQTRFVQGREYPVHVRRRAQAGAPEQLLLDGNALAQGHEYFSIGQHSVSSDGQRLAWTQDTVGRRQYVLRFKHLETGQLYPEEIANVEPDIAWTADPETVLYIEKDPETLLGTRVRRHRLGADPASDFVVYEEPDHAFYLSLWKGRSERFLNIYAKSTESTEQRIASADDPDLRFEVLIPRRPHHEYLAEDHDDGFVLRTNLDAPNFRIVEAPRGRLAEPAAWHELVPPPSAGLIESLSVFSSALAYIARADGLEQLRIRRWSDGKTEAVAMPDPTYSLDFGDNRAVESPFVRISYASLQTPDTTYDYELATGRLIERKRDWVGDDFKPERYESAYLKAPARDGATVPVSVVFSKARSRDGSGPLLVTGYGSYGLSEDPRLNRAWLSLLDRGVAVAIAHVRGGQELGRDWYEQGRLLRKRNTFTDFIDATDFLVAQGYAAHDRVAARGGSAGGLLMGAVANLAAGKYRTIAAHVPFVDVVTTMLDESIPLTTNEFDEWGNPKQKLYYDYILSYSPYDNVRAQAYPALYVSTGLWDSQVQYYEPLKWVARLRAHKTDQHPLVLHVNMGAGHGGKSGRFAAQEQVAEEYAFMLDQLGVAMP
jgi:oligopeptidase B